MGGIFLTLNLNSSLKLRNVSFFCSIIQQGCIKFIKNDSKGFCKDIVNILIFQISAVFMNRMISEESCKSEDWSDDAKTFRFDHRNKLYLKFD